MKMHFYIGFLLAASVLALPSSRILNGDTIEISQVPFQVSLQDRYGNHFCGGTIISTKFVATAAHCVDSIEDPSDILIRLDSNDRTKGGILDLAKAIKYHEEYDEETLENDIALIQMRVPIKGVHTADLAYTDFPEGTEVLVSGWGMESEDASELPTKLKAGTFKIVSLEECRRIYGEDVIFDTNICAMSDDSNVCPGDSGGPLTIEGIFLGVISWGYGCNRAGFPVVFSSIPEHFEWIRETMNLFP